MKTFRQYLKHIQEQSHHSSSTEDASDTDDDIEDMSPEEGEALIRQKFGPKELPQFDRLNKSAEFDFRKGIVEPEPEEWEPDVRIGKPVEPYDREAEFLAAFDQPNGEPSPGSTRWEYVPNTDAKDNTRWVPSSEADSIASWKANNPGKSDLDWGTIPPAAAPALDTTKPNAKYRFNRNTQQQELDTAPDNQPITWRDIYRLNKKTIGSDPRLIKPGQVLKMPNGAPDHTVQKGDTLIRIAAQDSTAAQFKQPDRPVTPTPVQKPAATITPIPGNIQPRVTANTGLNFPPHAGFGLDKGEEIVTPNTLKARKQAADFMAAYEKKQQARAELKQAAKRSMKEGSTRFIKHLRDYIVEVETAPAFVPNQTMDPQQAAAANKAAQEFVAQLTAKVKTLAQTQADVLKTVTARPVSAPQPAPAQPAQLNEGLFDGIVSWVKDALAKNPLIDIALRLIPSPAQAILAAIDVIDAVKSGRLADAAQSLAGMIPGGQQVAQAIGVGQAAAAGDATSVATGLASAALPKIGEASELDRILAIARHPR